MFGHREYRRELPHFQNDHHAYFVTFVSHKRRILPPIAREVTLQHVIKHHDVRAFIHVAVVMPEHVHVLLTPLIDGHGYTHSVSEILKLMKGATSRAINQALGRSGRVWQDESFDHELRNSESLLEKAEYIRQNPVRRALVSRPEDYPWLWRPPM